MLPKYVICVVVVLSCIGLSEASCRVDGIRTETTIFGRVVKYCEYKGFALLPGSNVKNKEACEEAICTDSGLSICGIGINAGVIAVEPGCIIVPDGCLPKAVSVDGCSLPIPPIRPPILPRNGN